MRLLALSLLAASCASRVVSPAAPPLRPPVDAQVLDAPPPADAPVVVDAPVVAAPLVGAARLVIGEGASCALLDDARVSCWRGSEETARPAGHIDDELSMPLGAVIVPGLADVVDVCLGSAVLCALGRDGAVVCRAVGRWSSPLDGDEFAPEVFVATLPGARDVAALEGGYACSLRRRDGRVEQVGAPSRSGEPWTLRPLTPSEAPAPRCELVEGAPRCSGDNSRALIENSTARAIPPRAPVALFGLAGVRAVSFGPQHACAAMRDGTARCWGRNIEGQLGTGDRRSRALPTAVPGIDRVVAVGVGGYSTCALREGGDVRCWGVNREGELGDGTLIDRAAPVAVAGLDEAVELRVQGRGACARTRGGGVWCWGEGLGPRGEMQATGPRQVMLAPP